MPSDAAQAASNSLKETRDKDSSLAAALKTAVFAKPTASDSFKEARDKDSSLAAEHRVENRRFMANCAKPAASAGLYPYMDGASCFQLQGPGSAAKTIPRPPLNDPG